MVFVQAEDEIGLLHAAGRSDGRPEGIHRYCRSRPHPTQDAFSMARPCAPGRGLPEGARRPVDLHGHLLRSRRSTWRASAATAKATASSIRRPPPGPLRLRHKGLQHRLEGPLPTFCSATAIRPKMMGEVELYEPAGAGHRDSRDRAVSARGPPEAAHQVQLLLLVRAGSGRSPWLDTMRMWGRGDGRSGGSDRCKP